MDSTIYYTYFFSIAFQFAALVIQHIGINLKTPEKHKPLTMALGMVYIVCIIEFIVYLWIGLTLSDPNKMMPRRYVDWFITTNVLLIVISILFIYEENKENGFEKKLTFKNMITDNKDIFAKILGFNNLMLICWFLGEINVLEKIYSFPLGMLFFIMGFHILYKHFAKFSKFGRTFFPLFIAIWVSYGFTHLMPSSIKNSAYNLLDLVLKNSFGLYFVHRVGNI
jgi:hypothetical protein